MNNFKIINDIMLSFLIEIPYIRSFNTDWIQFLSKNTAFLKINLKISTTIKLIYLRKNNSKDLQNLSICIFRHCHQLNYFK